MKKVVILLTATILTACAETSPLQVIQGLFGYIPPPEETSIAEELKLEFDRCEKIDSNRNCAQIAYDMVRTVKGLEPRKVPKGVVIILEGDVDMEPSEDKNKNQEPEK
jgi:hypothetical protein